MTGAIRVSILAIGLAIPAAADEPKATVAIDVELRSTTPHLDGSKSGSSSVEETIKALDTEYQRAVLRRDLGTMDRILAEEFVLITGKGTTQSKRELMDEVASPQLTFERQESSRQAVRAWGDTAVVTALLFARGTNQGKPFEYRLWYSDVYIRKPEGWRYVFAHAAQPLSP